MNTAELSKRDVAILSGLYLSRFDAAGLEKLGLTSFREAYNVLGFALGLKPATIKNYRDELDPLFPNTRKGWHGRPLRSHCEKIFEQFRNADLEQIISILAQHTGCNFNSPLEESISEGESSHSKRLLTGKAAENFFLINYRKEKDFSCLEAIDVTNSGCGYDFRLENSSLDNFFAVEVKGLAGERGTVTMTEKEYGTSLELQSHYYLYIVSNFAEKPVAKTFRNPSSSEISFLKHEKMIKQVTWTTYI
jgi:hypothetical protein